MFFIQVVQGNYCEAAGIGNQPLLNVFCVNELGAGEGATMRSASLGDDGSVKLVVMRQGALDEAENVTLNHPFSATDLFSGYSLDADMNLVNNTPFSDPDVAAAASAASALASYNAQTGGKQHRATGSSSSSAGHDGSQHTGLGGGLSRSDSRSNTFAVGNASSLGIDSADAIWLSNSISTSGEGSGGKSTPATAVEVAGAVAVGDPSLLEDPVVHWGLPPWLEGVSFKVMSKRKALGNMLKGFANNETPYASLVYHHAFSQIFEDLVKGGGGDSKGAVYDGSDEDYFEESDGGADSRAQIVVGSDLGLSEATLLRIAAMVSEVATMLDFPNNRPHLRVVLAYFRKLALERDLSFLAQAQPWNCSRKRSAYLMEDLITVTDDMSRRTQEDALDRVARTYPDANDLPSKAEEAGISLGGCYNPSYAAVLFGNRLVAETDGEFSCRAAVRNGVEKRSLLGRLFNGGANDGANSGIAGGMDEVAGDAPDKVKEEDANKTVWSIDRFVFHQLAAAFHAMPSCRAGYLTPVEWRILRLEHVLRRFGINRHNVSQQRQRLFLVRYLSMLRRAPPTVERAAEAILVAPIGGVKDAANVQPLALKQKTPEHQAADTYEFYFRELFHLCSDVQGDEVEGSPMTRDATTSPPTTSAVATLDEDLGNRLEDDENDAATVLSDSRAVSAPATREASPVLDEADKGRGPAAAGGVAATTRLLPPSSSYDTAAKMSRGQQPNEASLGSTRNTSALMGRASHARRSARQSNVALAASHHDANDSVLWFSESSLNEPFRGGYATPTTSSLAHPGTTTGTEANQPQQMTAREHLLQQRRFYSNKIAVKGSLQQQLRASMHLKDGHQSTTGANSSGANTHGIEYTHLLPKRHSYHDPCRYHSTFFVGDEFADSYTIDLDQLDCIPDQLSTCIKGILLRGRDKADSTLVIDWIESPEVPENAAAAAVCPDGFGIVLLYSGPGILNDNYEDVKEQLSTLQMLDDEALDHLGKCILMRFPSSFHQVQYLTSPLVASYNVPGLIHFVAVNRRVNTSVAGNFDAEIHNTSSTDNDTRLGLHMMHELMAHNVSRAHDLMANGFSEGLWGHLGVQFFYCVTHMPTRGQLRTVYAEQEAAMAARPSTNVTRPTTTAGGGGRPSLLDGLASTTRSTDMFDSGAASRRTQQHNALHHVPGSAGLPPKRSGGVFGGLFNNSRSKEEPDRSHFTKSFVLDAGVYSPTRPQAQIQRGTVGGGASGVGGAVPVSSSGAGNGDHTNGGTGGGMSLGGSSFLLSDHVSLLPSTMQQLCYRPSFIPDYNDSAVVEFYGLFVGCMSPVEVCSAVEYLFAKLYV